MTESDCWSWRFWPAARPWFALRAAAPPCCPLLRALFRALGIHPIFRCVPKTRSCTPSYAACPCALVAYPVQLHCLVAYCVPNGCLPWLHFCASTRGLRLCHAPLCQCHAPAPRAVPPYGRAGVASWSRAKARPHSASMYITLCGSMRVLPTWARPPAPAPNLGPPPALGQRRRLPDLDRKFQVNMNLVTGFAFGSLGTRTKCTVSEHCEPAGPGFGGTRRIKYCKALQSESVRDWLCFLGRGLPSKPLYGDWGLNGTFRPVVSPLRFG